VRRFPAILLLALFSFSLLSPVSGSDSDANLPACCRLAGKHHCAMRMDGGDSQSGPGFRANGKCPLYPSVVFSFGGFSALHLSPAASSVIPDKGRTLRTQSVQSILHTLRARSHQKRGPPSLS
jgi:hypothetical protein